MKNFLSKFMGNRQRLLVLIPIIILGAIGVLTVVGKSSSPTHPTQTFLVTENYDGWQPKEISIHQGDTVKFTSTRGQPFWPASDLHPTHTIYPQFDPKQPIGPNDSWTFSFDRVGDWRFHDHLAPFYTGVIHVQSGTSSVALPNCSGTIAKEECWSKAVDQTVKDRGVDAGLDLVDQIYRTDPMGPASCHNLTHLVGQAAFDLFAKKKEFKVTEKAAYCNYGFYHGFMERLISSGYDLTKAGDFCDYIDQQLKTTAPSSGLQCYHGIGHGTVSTHDLSLWGKEQAMIAPALDLCHKVTKNEENYFRCASGVFNGIGNFYVTGEYKLVVRKDDPYWICKLQMETDKAACYGNLHPTITWLAGQDFSKAVALVERDAEPNYLATALRYVTGDFARLSIEKADFTSNIQACHNLSGSLPNQCVLDFVTGLMDHGQPNSEYILALQFCQNSALSTAEQDSCLKYTFPYLATMYSKDKFNSLCSSVDDRLKTYCRVN